MATEQCDYMRKNCQFERVEDDCSIADNSLVVTLLNVRSLTKHGIDVSYDKSIIESDIIAFSETQLLHDYSLLDQDLKTSQCNNSQPETLDDLLWAIRSSKIFSFNVFQRIINIIWCFLLTENDIHMIFGNFNINALERNNYMSQYLFKYKMTVTFPTHISGSLLDHVYVLHNFLKILRLLIT